MFLPVSKLAKDIFVWSTLPHLFNTKNRPFADPAPL